VRFVSDPGNTVQVRPWEDNHLVREIRSPEVRKHRIGERCHVIRIPAETTSRPPKTLAWRHVGQDNRDRESEVISVEIRAGREAFLPVIQAMPASLQNWSDPGV
jgi:hypothetical protein